MILMNDSSLPTVYVLYKTIFTRLYKTGFSMKGGTLLHLRKLINRRNISSNIGGKFHAAIDFFELVVTGYVLAAAMVTEFAERHCYKECDKSFC